MVATGFMDSSLWNRTVISSAALNYICLPTCCRLVSHTWTMILARQFSYSWLFWFPLNVNPACWTCSSPCSPCWLTSPSMYLLGQVLAACFFFLFPMIGCWMLTPPYSCVFCPCPTPRPSACSSTSPIQELHSFQVSVSLTFLFSATFTPSHCYFLFPRHLEFFSLVLYNPIFLLLSSLHQSGITHKVTIISPKWPVIGCLSLLFNIAIVV